MKNNTKKILIAALAVFCIAGFASRDAAAIDCKGEWLGEKPEWAPEVSLSTAFLTKYIWRGWNLGDEPVMQVDASLSKWGITLDIWGNYSFNDEKDRDGGRYQEFTELDYTIDYTFNVGDMSEQFDVDSPDFLDP